MTLHIRSKKVLDELTQNPSITSRSLEKKLGLSRRQLNYTIDKINEWLIQNDLPVIERTRQGQFIIDQSIYSKLVGNNEKIKAASESVVLSVEQRITLILLMLISSEEELSLNHFVYELGVSKNTILSDMKKAKKLLAKYDLNLIYSRKWGYYLTGTEFQIRKLLAKVVSHMMQIANGEEITKKLANISDKQIDEFRHRIIKVENQLSYKYTDEKMKTMPIILILILRRIKNGKLIEDFSIEYQELSNTNEYKATEQLLTDIDHIPESERIFITLYLLTANVFSSDIELEETIPNLTSAVDEMLRQFEKSACIFLQDRDQLIEELLQHLKPAYYRIKYQLHDSIFNHEELVKELKELHHLVKRSITPLEELIGTTIPENEIAYITMLIGGWLERQGESIDNKIKAIVVCPQGVSVSILLFNELRKLFPEFVFLDYLSVREFLQYDLEYDIVFSTVELDTDKKLFVTKSILGQEEKKRLRKQVMLAIYGFSINDIKINSIISIIEKYATIHNEQSLKEELESLFRKNNDTVFLQQNITQRHGNKEYTLDQLITPETIILMESVHSWEEAIRISAKPLLRSGKIEPRYIDAMIRYCANDPYIVIAPNVAIPHAAPDDGALAVGMSMLRLKKGVQYTKEFSINLIITIATIDKQKHIQALMQLMNLVGSDTDRNKVIQANSVEEIMRMVKKYAKEKQ